MSKPASPIGVKIQPPASPAKEAPSTKAPAAEPGEETEETEETEEQERRPPPRMRTGIKIGAGNRKGGWDANHALCLP